MPAIPAAIRSPAGIGATAALGVMWLAQVSIPLTDRGDRAPATTVVVVALAVAVAFLGAAAVGPARAVTALAAVAALGLAVEVVGTRTGFPFGRYEYTGSLRPTVGGVPVAVVLAWFGMGVPSWALAGRLAASTPGRIGVAAVAMVGWDLFLDPQQVAEGYWTWEAGGAYRGIPLTNFLGWALAGAGVAGLCAVLVPTLSGDRPLTCVYALMCAMEALGFVAFFGDPFVGLVGASVTGPLCVAALLQRTEHAARPVVRVSPGLDDGG